MKFVDLSWYVAVFSLMAMENIHFIKFSSSALIQRLLF